MEAGSKGGRKQGRQAAREAGSKGGRQHGRQPYQQQGALNEPWSYLPRNQKQCIAGEGGRGRVGEGGGGRRREGEGGCGREVKEWEGGEGVGGR